MMRKMEAGDLEEVAELEKILFTSYWKKSDFEYELQQNPYAVLKVIEIDGKIAAYCDRWILFDQAQIATIGVAEEYQHQGLGQQLMASMIFDAIAKECDTMSLEVRVSNDKAIALYKKNGFITVNTRKGYYQDNHEDAYLMVKPLGGMKNDEDISN